MFTVQNNEVFPYPVGVNFVVTPYKPVFTISHNTVQAIIARNDNQKIAAISELRKLCSDQGLSLLDAKQIVELVQYWGLDTPLYEDYDKEGQAK